MTSRAWLGIAAMLFFFGAGLTGARHDWAEAAVCLVLAVAFAQG